MNVTESQLREASRIICCATDAAYAASLRGDVPRGSYENFRPIVGNYVIESSTLWMAKSDKYPHLGDTLNNVGLLERIAQEPVFTQEEWNEGGDGPDVPIPTETAYYIRTLDGRELRWTNARMIRVPDDRGFSIMRPAHAG